MIIYWNEVKVGLLVILSVALVFMVAVMVGNLQDYFDDTIPVKILIDQAIGLDMHAEVTYSGVRIGTVTSIEYSEEHEKAMVTAEIKRDSPVSSDSKARITSSRMLAPNFLEISGGSEALRLNHLLRTGKKDLDEIYLEADPYTSISDVFSLAGDVRHALNKVEVVLEDLRNPLQKASGLIDSVSDNLKIVMRELRFVVEESRPELKRFLLHLNGLIEEASASIKPILAKVDKGVGKVPTMLDDTSLRFQKLLTSANGLVESVSPQIFKTTMEVRESLRDLRDKIGRVEHNLSTLLQDADNLLVENEQDIARIIDRLERTSVNLDELSAQLSKNPWRAIWKTEEIKSPPRVSPEWEPFEAESN